MQKMRGKEIDRMKEKEQYTHKHTHRHIRTYSLSTFLNILHANTSDSPVLAFFVALLMKATGSFSWAAYRRAIRINSPSPA
jgi:hypothetical protein